MPERIRERALGRLVEAEQNGLRLAIFCRTAATAAGLVWYLGASVISPDFEVRALAILSLLAFTAFGILHLSVIGTRFDRAWIKFAIYAADIAGVCAMFVLIPVSSTGDVPQIIAFRAYGIYYLFPLVAMTCLSLSWRLVIWAGCVAVIGWWTAFLWIVAGMDSVYSWGDIPQLATREDYENVFLSARFIGVGNRIEETGLLLAGALILGLAVYRARKVFFAQIAAEVRQEEERQAREQVTDTLGRYVPEAIVHKLVEGPDALAPQVRHGSVLVLDIADFTRFAADRHPHDVIVSLDSFLADASDIVSKHEGIVITFTGDGLLATFNAPIEIDLPEPKSVRAALDLLAMAERSEFDIRIGIASGDIAAGNIGSSRRQAFTVYGDTVNLASRLESQCKQLGMRLLIDASTDKALNADFTTVSVGKFALRGLEGEREVFNVEFVSRAQDI